eukprot:m.134137 g.134137  ORF g.134137 m.134137 type:complete len:1210 (+) comp29722_c0_seq1:135-3764(+)
MQIIQDQEWLAVLYVVATVLFIMSLRGLGHESTAKVGTVYGIIGMAIAVGGTLGSEMVRAEAYWILPIAIVPASICGIIYAYTVETDRLPELVGLFNAFGGLAAALEGLAIYVDRYARASIYTGDMLSKVDLGIQLLVAFLSVIIGMMTFAGSLIAVMKLTPRGAFFHIDSKPKTFPGRNLLMIVLALGIVADCVVIYWIDYPFSCSYTRVNGTAGFEHLECTKADDATIGVALMIVLAFLSALIATLNTLGVSGSDMAVVIAVLNSGSGWGGVAAGFMISNELLLVTGAFVGASGAILALVMCEAMNLDVLRVLGLKPPKVQKARDPNAKEIIYPDPIVVNVAQTANFLREAQDIIISPGYGMAAAGAQVVVGQLVDNLRRMGKRVRFAIHPVAGRLPGHMNILLAEANVPYDIVMSMEDINDQFKSADLAICVGAWDTVNPEAAEDPESPVFGMPMCRVWEAKHCIVNKRSLPKQGQTGGGFSGARNTLPYKESTRMFLGSAKDVFTELNNVISAEVDSSMTTGGKVITKAAAVPTLTLEEIKALPTCLKVVIPCESEPDENRCAVTPASAIQLRQMGFDVYAEAGVGERANIGDAALAKAGVTLMTDVARLYAMADICFKVNPPTTRGDNNIHELEMVPEKSTFISFVGHLDRMETETSRKTEAMLDVMMARDRNLTLLGMQFLPRISRAQKSDALSTFAKLAGHRATLEASVTFGRVMAGEISAAGKNPPAIMFVAGCGVAGLEAVAFGKKLGAIVRATDVRMDCVEQVASVGGEFVHPDMEALAKGSSEGGYAKPDFSPEGQAKSKAMYAEQCPQCDIIITTAAIPGRPAPVLITAEMVASMKPGSVIVDIANGNCVLTRKGEKFRTENGVTIVGYTDYPSRMALQASTFYSNNLVNLVMDMCAHFVNNKATYETPMAKGFWVNMEITREQSDTTHPSYSKGSYATGDDILAGMVLTKDGKLDYPKPPPKSLSVAPVGRKTSTSSVPANTKPRNPWPMRIFTLVVAFGVIAVLAIVIAPDSPFFVGNVMIFVLASVLGYLLVMSVKPSLHTPLMSMSNAISGIVILGGMMQVQGEYLNNNRGNATQVLGAIAAGVASINVAGGFAVTFRMLAMFKKSPTHPVDSKPPSSSSSSTTPPSPAKTATTPSKPPSSLVGVKSEAQPLVSSSSTSSSSSATPFKVMPKTSTVHLSSNDGKDMAVKVTHI